MRTDVVLNVKCADVPTRKSLTSVLAPDNEGAPQGLKLSAGGSGREVEFVATAESPSTSLSTALALLRDIALFQEVWLLSRGSPG